MLIADSCDTEYKLSLLIAEVNAVRILDHDDLALLYSAFRLCCAVRDGNTHAHVCGDKFLTLKHCVDIRRLDCSGLDKELTGSLDCLLLGYRRLIELNAVRRHFDGACSSIGRF